MSPRKVLSVLYVVKTTTFRVMTLRKERIEEKRRSVVDSKVRKVLDLCINFT